MPAQFNGRWTAGIRALDTLLHTSHTIREGKSKDILLDKSDKADQDDGIRRKRCLPETSPRAKECLYYIEVSVLSKVMKQRRGFISLKQGKRKTIIEQKTYIRVRLSKQGREGRRRKQCPGPCLRSKAATVMITLSVTCFKWANFRVYQGYKLDISGKGYHKLFSFAISHKPTTPKQAISLTVSSVQSALSSTASLSMIAANIIQQKVH